MTLGVSLLIESSSGKYYPVVCSCQLNPVHGELMLLDYGWSLFCIHNMSIYPVLLQITPSRSAVLGGEQYINQKGGNSQFRLLDFY